MTFTIFKEKYGWPVAFSVVALAFLGVVITMIVMIATAPSVSVRNRVPTLPATAVPDSAIAAAPDVPKAPKEAPAAPEDKERPYYGSGYYNELLTSVYFYPDGGSFQGSPDEPFTHLKFNHREDDLYLCGDQRSKFLPGKQYTLVVSFEPNRECATNWKIQ